MTIKIKYFEAITRMTAELATELRSPIEDIVWIEGQPYKVYFL